MSYWWVGARSFDSVGLHRLIPIDAVISCDSGSDAELIEAHTGARLFSVERLRGGRSVWTPAILEESIAAFRRSDAFEGLSRAGAMIVPYRSYPALERLVAEFPDRLRVAAPDSAIVTRLDDKHYAFQAMSRREIPSPRGRVAKLNETTYDELKAEFGERLVIKRTNSGSGSGTRLVFGSSDFRRIATEMGDEQVLLNEFVDGLSYNVHGVVTGSEVLVSPPSIQLVGVEGCSDQPQVYCGNDFSACAAGNPAIVRAIESVTRQAGAWMAEEGFRGLFGLDVVGTAEHMVIIDVNPRFQGSTPLLTHAELLAGRAPLVLRHIEEFCGAGEAFQVLRHPTTAARFENPSPCPAVASQILVHALNKQPVIMTAAPRPGVYVPGPDDRPIFVRPALSVLDGLSSGEFLVTCGVVRPGSIVGPGADLLKIVVPEAVLDLKTGRLTEEAARIVSQVRATLEMQPA